MIWCFSHECMMCDKICALDGMIMCHRCGDMTLCLNCFCSSHNGHEIQQLRNHVDNQVKQLQQWKEEKLPVLDSLTLFPSAVSNKCKALIDQHQIQHQTIGKRRRDFEIKLGHLIDASEKELNAGNGYKYDFASFEEQMQSIQDEHKQSIRKRQELADTVWKMLQSGDLPEGQIDMTETGISLSDGRRFEFYCPSTNTTQLIDIEMQRRFGFVMEVLSDGKVIVAGGRMPYSTTRSSQIIDLIYKQVMQGPPMTTERSCPASAMIGGEMFVCGGKDGKTLSSCEVYKNGQWISIANMKMPRADHAVVALNGLLYAIGGSYIGGLLNSLECYAPNTNNWQQVSSLKEPRIDFSAAAFNGYIYVAGGWEGVKSCERYCPKRDQWEAVAPMNKGRHSFSLMSFGCKLYALGGDGEGSVESYDAEKNEWKIEDITLNRRWLKAVVLNYQPN